jgi:hypothetical protein
MSTTRLTIRYNGYVTHSLTVDEICRLTGAPQPFIHKMIDEEIVRPVEVSDRGPLFAPESLGLIERSLRLHNDLGVNWSGVAIIQNLVVRMKQLEQEVLLAHRRMGDSMDCDFEM